MADPLRSKFQQWLVMCILIPAAILALISNAFLWRTLQQIKNRASDDLAAAAQTRLEHALRAESVRLRTVANIPAVAAMLSMGQRRDSADETPETIQLQWARAQRDDLLVRGVLDNDVAMAFARMNKQDPYLGQMALCDSRGNLVAATEKVDRYSQLDQAWWKHARGVPPGSVSAEAIEADGRVTLVAGVMRAGFTNMVDGQVYVKMDLKRLLEGMTFSDRADDVVYLLGPGVLPVVGASNEVARLHGDLARFLTAGETSGWAHGYRFRVRRLSGGVEWREPVVLVTALQQAPVTLAQFAVAAGGLIVSGLALYGLMMLARKLGYRWFLEPMRETSEAGIWILRTAYGEEAETRPSMQQSWAKAITERTSQIQRDLTRWLNKWRQELQAQSSTVDLELKRDLELATEFQQAFLNRPYPRIPEVHIEGRLRLEFNHRYQPALAMGGDFFDISSLAPDCAGIFVADVMGHGTRSALIVSILRTLIAELSRRGRNAPHFIRELNTDFCTMLKSLPSPFFASAAYLVADTTSRMATYAFAGHPPPFHLYRATGRVSRLEMPKPQGAALGLIPNEEYGGASVRLNPGDGFIFFTDGVYEAANRQGEEFGLARLEKVIRANVYRSSPDILNAIMKAIADFAGDEPVADDICLVTVDVTTDPIKPA
jgi:serine phosphatase RsbU (regulator of sigma subunit)